MTNSSNLAHLAHAVSYAASRARTGESLAAEAVARLAAGLPSFRAAIVLKHHSAERVTHHTAAGSDFVPSANQPPVFTLARPIRIRGVHYGAIHLESACAPSAPNLEPLLAKLLEITAVQIGLYCDRLRLELERDRLKAALSTEKVVARAAGIIARDRGIPLAGARQWLHAEAARTGKSLFWLCDMFVAGRGLLMHPGVPGRPSAARRQHEEYAA